VYAASIQSGIEHSQKNALVAIMSPHNNYLDNIFLISFFERGLVSFDEYRFNLLFFAPS
jgi:hypothetical protein